MNSHSHNAKLASEIEALLVSAPGPYFITVNRLLAVDIMNALRAQSDGPSGAWRCPTCSATCIPRQAKPEAGADDARDAARYRWLRDRSDPDMEQPYITRHKVNSWGKWFNTCDKGDYADSVIDAELAKSNATPD